MVLQSPALRPMTPVRVYADDVLPQTNARGERWLYMVVLVIDDSRHADALTALDRDRTDAGYQGEVHFAECNDYRMADLARRWLDRVIWDDPRGLFRFHVLGIRTDFLNRSAFGGGGSKQTRRIYARFFRSALSYSLQSLFHGQVSVQAVFHDRTALEHDEWFDWHAIWRLGREVDRLGFDCRQIQFVDSDHRTEPKHPTESHLVQLADVVLGSVRQALDATSTADHKVRLGRQMLPLVERLTTPRLARNRNSRYRFVGRCSVSFFPKARLTVRQLQNPIERLRPSFYSGREPLLGKLPGQEVLSHDTLSLF